MVLLCPLSDSTLTFRTFEYLAHLQQDAVLVAHQMSLFFWSQYLVVPAFELESIPEKSNDFYILIWNFPSL